MHPLAAEAAAAEAAGDLDRALALYQRLETEAPDAPMWSKKLAGVHRQRNDLDARIEALVRAADKHNARGELMKGIATLKSAQNIAPKHPALLTAMDRLRRARPSTPAASPALPQVGDQALAVIPLIRRARAASGITPPIVEVQSRDLDPRAEPNDPIPLDILPPIPLFSSLDGDTFARLLDRSTQRPVADGATIFEKGTRGDALFVVVDGAVDVFLAPDAPPVARLTEGTFFGEMSLFTGRPRNATVRASGPGELLVIDHDEIHALIGEAPEILSNLLEFFRERLATNVLMRLGGADLSEASRRELRACFTLLDVAADHAIIEQGRPSPGLFVVVDGTLSVDHVSAFGNPAEIATLEPGAICGEISTMTEVPATATVIAKTDAIVLGLPRENLGAVAARHPVLLDYARQLAAERLEALNGPLWT
ncbi:MAG: cyclic nucleotide-binding domain-containing protein [Deltaproteobacteria bacterium]